MRRIIRLIRLLDIVPSLMLQVTQTVSNSTPNYNSNVIFTITVRNNGPNDVNGVQIKDLLPSGLNLGFR